MLLNGQQQQQLQHHQHFLAATASDDIPTVIDFPNGGNGNSGAASGKKEKGNPAKKVELDNAGR